MRSNLSIFIYSVISLLIFVSCSDREAPNIAPLVSRTIIVYMATDNDLSADAIQNLRQIENAYKNTGAKLVVFIDTFDDMPRILELTENKRITVKEYQEFNSVAAEKMNEVLQEIIDLYPAKEYGLVLWSHGTSWLPAEKPLRSFGKDGSRELNITDLAQALPVKFDFILFDACLMGAVEVAYELKDKADYIIATSTETIAEGFPYMQIVPELLQAQINFKTVATRYFNFYNSMNGAYRSATISVIETQHLAALAQQAKLLFENNEINFSPFDRTTVQRLDVYDEQYHFDLLDFINKLLPNADKTAFVAQLEQTIIYKNHTPQFILQYDINTFCGLSCYIPLSYRRDLTVFYKTLKWYEDSGTNQLF